MYTALQHCKAIILQLKIKIFKKGYWQVGGGRNGWRWSKGTNFQLLDK